VEALARLRGVSALSRDARAPMRGTLGLTMCGICVMIPGIRARQPRDGQMNCGNQSAHISLIHRRFTALASRDPCAVDLKMFNIKARKTVKFMRTLLTSVRPYQLLARAQIHISRSSRGLRRTWPGRLASELALFGHCSYGVAPLKILHRGCRGAAFLACRATRRNRTVTVVARYSCTRTRSECTSTRALDARI
jgi:hypothetical protein